MNETKLSTWILWAVILFSLVITVDYFFFHILFKDSVTQGTSQEDSSDLQNNNRKLDDSFIEDRYHSKADAVVRESDFQDNFFETLQNCAPEIAAQTIATPEALLAYLQNSVGIKTEEVSIENYHLTLPDGSIRRVHVVVNDNTNSPDKKEIRLFKLDDEGYPERLDLPAGATLKSLIEMGKLDKHEIKKAATFQDGSSIDAEMHDKKVYEFQYNNHGKVFSCRFSNCHCSK